MIGPLCPTLSYRAFDRYHDANLPKRDFPYKEFKNQLMLTRDLSSYERLTLLRKVCQFLQEREREGIQKIQKIATRCGVQVDLSSSDEILETDLLEGVKNFPSLEKKERIFELVYDLFRFGQIVTAKRLILQTFFLPPFPFQEQDLEECFHLKDQVFPGMFSRQLCRSFLFLRFNLHLVLKYMLPFVSHDENIVFNILNIASTSFCYGYEHIIEGPFKELIEFHYKTLFEKVVKSPYYVTNTLKIALAKVVLDKDPDFLSLHFLYLFKEEDIFIHYPFSSTIAGIFHDLVRLMEKRHDDVAEYFKKTQMYLERWRSSPLLRWGGFSLVESRLMLKSTQEISKEFPIPPADSSMPRDTPMWREIGYVTTDQGIDRIFKLDWDFDSLTEPSHSTHSRTSDVFYKGTSDDLVNLLFPAIVTRLNGNLFNEWWARILGYGIQRGGNGVYMTLPEPATLIQRLPMLLNDERSVGRYREFTLKEGEGSASVAEFIESFLTRDCFCSTTTEFVHDHLFHVLRTLNIIMETTSEEYSALLESARGFVRLTKERIERAGTEEQTPQDKRMLEVVRVNLGIFADVYTTFTAVAERKEFIQDIFQGKGWLRIWGGTTGQLWRQVYHVEEEISVARIQEYWDKIVKA